MLQQFLENLGIKPNLILIGALSALFGAKIEGEKSLVDYLFRTFGGAITTTFTTPLFVEYFDLSQSSSYGLGFFIGLVSMNLVKIILNLSSNVDEIGRAHV